MSENRRNEDDVNLTGMIHEYGQDNELRKKIEEMKRQKELERANAAYSAPLETPPSPSAQPENTGTVYHSELFDDVRPASMFHKSKEEPEKGFANIQVDHTMIDKTRMDLPNEDGNKTLVIMDGKRSTRYNDDPTQTQVIIDDYQDVYEQEAYDVNKTIVKPLSDLENVRQLNLDDVEEEEYDEEDGNSNDKTNKIITYVIIGIVAIAVIIGGFFGVKYLLGSMGSSDTATSDKTESDTTKKDTVTNKTDTTTPSKKENVTNNDAAIASLKKQLEEYKTSLATANTNLATAQTAKQNADQVLAGLEANKKTAKDTLDNYYKLTYKPVEDAYNAAEAAYKADEKNEALKKARDEALAKLNTEYATYTQYSDQAIAAEAEYDNSPKHQEAQDAQEDIDAYTTQVNDLSAKMNQVNTDLAAYGL